MEVLFIKPTEDNPMIQLDPVKGVMSFSGNSMPENASLFYEPVILWLEEYNKNPHYKTTFIFSLKVISSSSTKVFFDILSKIDALFESGKSEVNVIWHYTVYDDEIREIGMDYKESMDVPFELVLIEAGE